MNYRLVASLLVASLLFLTAAGLGGCGTSNTLSAIAVSPTAPVVAPGAAQQLLVTAIFSNGMTVPLWTRVTWASSNPAVASVGTNGLVTGIVEGTAVITATDIGHPDIIHSVTVSVTKLISITIAPADATISAGTGTQFTATGNYTLSSDGTPTAWSPTWPPDLTTLVSWVSASTSIALISNETGSQGIATAVSAGTTTITATDPATGITGTATLTVP